MDVIRDNYLNKIRGFVNKPIIKILTGMRRVGKSTLLKIIKDQVLREVDEKNKIYMNFESINFYNIRDEKVLFDYIKKEISGLEGKIYFFFDEVQLVNGWERVVNAINTDLDCDIYITGSNSILISGEISTLLAGRFVNFEIQPFVFSEYIKLFENYNIEDLFLKYIELGGMPGTKYFDLDREDTLKYLNDAYNTALVKDVLEYNNIRDVDLFKRVLRFIAENIGHVFSANSIKNYLKSENRVVSVDTILNYIVFCKDAFIIKKVPRYDVGGKKILKVDEKYFITDHGYREAIGFSNQKDIERTLENIVYIELLSKGFDVFIGGIDSKEIDFIATKGNEKIYIQVCYMLGDEKTREREFGIYKSVDDNYPKYVLSMDKINFSQEGIIHMNIIDFLLNKNSN